MLTVVICFLPSKTSRHPNDPTCCLLSFALDNSLFPTTPLRERILG